MNAIDFKDIAITGLRGILIDLDNTLYSYDRAHELGLRQTFAVSRWDMSYEEFAQRYRSARDKVITRLKPQGACRSRLFAFQDMCEAVKEARPYNRAFELDDIYWRGLIDAMTPDPSAIDFLKRCCLAELPICIVSDMTAHIQIRKLKKLGVDIYIDYMVTSEEVGAEKPDPRMFLTALQKLSLMATDALMVGDDIKKDIEGAHSLGLKTALVKASV
jgi:putative hydrolase of the HAD superfamily